MEVDRYVNAAVDIVNSIGNGIPEYKKLSNLYYIASKIISDYPNDYKQAIVITNYVRDKSLFVYQKTKDEDFGLLYWTTLRLEAQNYQVDSALIYLEKNREPKNKFYIPRRKVFMKFGIVQALQALIDDELDLLCVSLPPGTGKTTMEIFFLSLVGGWYPNDYNLSSAHSSILTRSIYDGINEILNDTYEYTWHEIFPNIKINQTNSKDTTINLERPTRFKTWTMRSIDGSLTGATRCNRFMTGDDLVSGIEEALNKARLETLWTKVVNDLRSRRLDGCKEVYFATRWSNNDPIGKIYERNKDNPRARFIAIPALDENGRSNFKYAYNGFSEQYFLDQKDAMDSISFDCLYQQKPIEREGLLFNQEDLQRFVKCEEDKYSENGELYSPDMINAKVMPDRAPDAIWAVCDTKDKGIDFEAMPIAYQYGQDFYIVDVVFDDTTDYAELDNKTATMLMRHNPHRTRFESNNAGSRVAYNVQQIIDERKKNGLICRVEIEVKYTTSNKETKILANSAWIKKHCFFLHHRYYLAKEDYGLYLANVATYTTKGKVLHDDAPDSLAMLAEFVQGIYSNVETEIVSSPLGRRYGR